jgi:divinyl protochlorophyllide a 8-vinyl-reductase
VNAPVAVPPALKQAALIGPDSVLQLVPLLDQHVGMEARKRLLDLSGISRLPNNDGLMDERPAAALHQAVRRLHPKQACNVMRAAGTLTADHVIERRMPVAALRVLRALPAWLSGPLLANTIEKHAWTFAGSGVFRVRSRDPLIFELEDNPVVRGERSRTPVCHWHAAVFQRLFNEIVDPQLRCVETHCVASGAHACRFIIE